MKLNKKTLTKSQVKHLERCETIGSIWAESEIVAFRSLLGTGLRSNPDYKNVRDAFLAAFNLSLETANFKLTKEQQDKGIAWLRATQLKSSGEIRNAQTTFIYRGQKQIIDNFSHFELSGLVNESCNEYAFYLPVYKCVALDGSSFEYVAASNARLV